MTYLSDFDFDFSNDEKALLVRAINNRKPGPVADEKNFGMFNTEYAIESVKKAIEKQQLSKQGFVVANLLLTKLTKEII